MNLINQGTQMSRINWSNRLQGKTYRLEVNFKKNWWDFKLKWMIKKGMSRKAIKRETGLSFARIAYRCRKEGLKVQLYRDGLDPKAVKELARLDRVIAKNRQFRARFK